MASTWNQHCANYIGTLSFPIALSSEEKNRASATGNVHIKFSEVWTCVVSEICERTDIHTDRHTDTLGAILRTDTIDVKKRCYVCFYIFVTFLRF